MQSFVYFGTEGCHTCNVPAIFSMCALMRLWTCHYQQKEFPRGAQDISRVDVILAIAPSARTVYNQRVTGPQWRSYLYHCQIFDMACVYVCVSV